MISKKLVLLVLTLSSTFAYAQLGYPMVDIHVHPDIKAFNSREHVDYNLWEKIDHECGADKMAMWMINGSSKVPKYSQSNYASLMNGGFGIICHSMTPMEKGFYRPRFLNIKKKGPTTVACMSGMHMTTYLMRSKEDFDYFPILKENIDFIKEGEKKPYDLQGRAVSYEIVKNKQHFQRLANDPNKLGVVLCIEGGHVLGRSLQKDDHSDQEKFYDMVMDNVLRLKGVKPMTNWKQDYLEHPIFFIGINHFFWNGLGGHARAFSGAQSIVFGGTRGVDEPISQLGKDVVKTLLSKEKGRRILLDAKHMSVDSRTWYYSYLDSLKHAGDNIPLIYSHAGVAGLSMTDKDFIKKDKKGKNKDSYFNRWSVNLADEEIKRIHDSNGLLGIMLDKYRLCGEKVATMIDAEESGSPKRKEIYIKLLAMNVLHAVKATGQKSGWDILCLGSDYDGMVQPFEFYDTAATLPDMALDLQQFLEQPTAIFEVFTAVEVKELLYDYTAAEVVEKLFSSNALEFIAHHFPD